MGIAKRLLYYFLLFNCLFFVRKEIKAYEGGIFKESRGFYNPMKFFFLLSITLFFYSPIFSGVLEVERLTSMYSSVKDGLHGPAVYVVADHQKFIDVEVMEEIGVKDAARFEKDETFPGFEADTSDDLRSSAQVSGLSFSQTVHRHAHYQ